MIILIFNYSNTMIINYKNEDKIIKNNIKILQSKMLTECKKQVGMLNNIHHHCYYVSWAFQLSWDSNCEAFL